MYRKVRILVLSILVLMGSISFAQLTEPGNDNGDEPTDGGIAGGGAPIGSAIGLVISMGLAYGVNKTFQIKFKE